MAQLPDIITKPGPMLQKITEVGYWIDSLKLREYTQNDGFKSPFGNEWAGRFSSAIWITHNNPVKEIAPLPMNIPRIAKGSPYCALTVVLVIRIAAKYANDLTSDERDYYLNKLGNASSQFPISANKNYVKEVLKPQIGTLNVRTNSNGTGHINITIDTNLNSLNGNGSCAGTIAGTERDASRGGGICIGKPAGPRYFLLRINNKWPLVSGNDFKLSSDIEIFKNSKSQPPNINRPAFANQSISDNDYKQTRIVDNTYRRDTIRRTEEEIAQADEQKKSDLVEIFQKLSTGILSQTNIADLSAEKLDETKEIKETKISTDYEAKQISVENVPKDTIEITYLEG